MKKNNVNKKSRINNQSGFMTAEFLFAFTMVIGCGILIFAMTFSLTTIEIAQYIVWSSARSYSVGNKTKEASKLAAKTKYQNITAAFPLLTGNGSDSPWFRMSTAAEAIYDDLAPTMRARDGALNEDNATPTNAEARHPWYGVQADIDLVLFKGLQIPFAGKVTEDPSGFKFPVRGILFRHPAQDECLKFFENRFEQGIQKIKAENNEWDDLTTDSSKYFPMEDNGC